jgi:nucleotidyltransferase substrate binding protein (TIGR01987 family)
MKDELDYSIKKLTDAFKKLDKGIQNASDELTRDGVIQRFEFTFELAWKALKIYLEHEGVLIKTPRESFVEAFRIGLIDNEKNYLDMLEDRNLTSHIYDKKTSTSIYKRIKKIYVIEFNKLIGELKTFIKKSEANKDKK